jgi:hypothetical protein
MAQSIRQTLLAILLDVFPNVLDEVVAVALTCVLNNYNFYLKESCSPSSVKHNDPIDMTLAYSCELVSKLSINSLETSDTVPWIWRWHELYPTLYQLPQFQRLIQSVYTRLAAHPCIDRLIEA